MLKKASLFFLALGVVSCTAVERPSRRSSPPSPVPVITPGRSLGSKTHYKILKGDSLWGIAKKYGISLASLRAANPGLNPNDLKIGQEIYIPAKPPAGDSVFLWPVEGKVINFFGETVEGIRNNGINIAVTPDNTNVSAAAAGTVIFANKLKGWGTTIILQHYPDTYTIYANLKGNIVQEGQRASKGATIAKVASGKNGNYVLHFEIRKKAVPKNPLNYLN